MKRASRDMNGSSGDHGTRSHLLRCSESRQTQTTLQGEAHPVIKRGFQFRDRCFFARTHCQQSGKSWNFSRIALIRAEMNDLSFFQSHAAVFEQIIHAGSMTDALPKYKSLQCVEFAFRIKRHRHSYATGMVECGIHL
jgi:hypothetical protein